MDVIDVVDGTDADAVDVIDVSWAIAAWQAWIKAAEGRQVPDSLPPSVFLLGKTTALTAIALRRA
jgi:hypothetical protein